MRVFRIERERYLNDALSGNGAAKSHGGRWNSFNTRMVYTAASRALAILEVAVHLDLSEDLPSDRYLVEIDIPDNLGIQTIREADLPQGWDAKPPMKVSQMLGDDFVRNARFAVMKVPSVIVPQEYNYLINPLHPDADLIKVVSTQPLVLDGRLQRAYR